MSSPAQILKENGSMKQLLKEAAKKYEELFELMEAISVTDTKELTEEERSNLSVECKTLADARHNLCRIISSIKEKASLDKEDHVSMIKDYGLKTEKDEYLPEFRTGVEHKESTPESFRGIEEIEFIPNNIFTNMKIIEESEAVVEVKDSTAAADETKGDLVQPKNAIEEIESTPKVIEESEAAVEVKNSTAAAEVKEVFKTAVEKKESTDEEHLATSEPGKYPFVEYRHPECFDFLFREYLPLPPPKRFLPIFSEADTINIKKRKRSPERSSIPERQTWPSWEDEWNAAMQELRDYDKVYLENFEQFKREDNYPHYEPEEEEDYYDEFKGYGDDPFGCEPNKEEEEEEERKREEEWKNISLKYLF